MDYFQKITRQVIRKELSIILLLKMTYNYLLYPPIWGKHPLGH